MPRIALILAMLCATARAEPATRAFIRKIARGQIKPAELVDPATGVVDVVYIPEAEEGEPRISRRLCGKAAEQKLAALRTFLVQVIDADEIFECHNAGGPPRCAVGIFGEFES